jgi:hypothetical protein
MMNVTLKQLRYFDALARHRHFGRAAEACGISQPALSIQMKDLEILFGAPLIDRSAREIRLSVPMASCVLSMSWKTSPAALRARWLVRFGWGSFRPWPPICCRI